MIGMLRFLLPYRDRRPGRTGPKSRTRAFLRIALRVLLLAGVAVAILTVGMPALDPVAMWRWMDASWVLLLLVRICVYTLVVWWGPVLRGLRAGDRDRARLFLAGVAVVLELAGSLLTL